MRTAKTLKSAAPERVEDTAEPDEGYEPLEIYRVRCRQCGQRIGLLADEEELPEHAMLPTPRNPFGLTVCQGSGAPAAGADEDGGQEKPAGQDAAVLLTLPQGLDWRMQPFSHAGRPAGVPQQAARS